MNDVKELIGSLVQKVDEKTTLLLAPKGHEKHLHLYGSRESRYLNGVAGKANKLWVPVRWFDGHPPTVATEALLVDRESFPKTWDEIYFPDAMNDLDNIHHDGLSCTAEACMWILSALGAVTGKHVCIVGRGHAVKGLADALLARDATVTVCHSKTKNLREIVMSADVLVNSAPKLHPYYSVGFKLDRILLDVSGGLAEWKNSNMITYIGSQDIGRLNVSLVLHRFALS